MEPIKLTDGTELVPMEQEEKDLLEAEIKIVLDKYGAMYLPVIKEEKTLSKVSQIAALFILKKKSPDVESPYHENGDNTKEETPKTD